MDAPAVQFVRTSDGYDIACGVCGEGPDLVLVPIAWSHVQSNWLHQYFMPGRAPFLREIATRFRVVTFDYRGHGLSQRAVKKVAMESYIRDLEAVILGLDLDRFVLVGPSGSGHVAVRYAAAHRERVKALVLLSCAMSNQALPSALFELLPAQNWEYFITTQLAPGLTPAQVEHGVELFKQTTAREDWLNSWPALAHSDISDVLPALRVPTLVIYPREDVLLAARESNALAASIRGSRLVTVDGKGPYGEPGQTVSAIQGFLVEPGDAQVLPPGGLTPDHLSSREAEVLRLLAAGKSNPQIAESLFISRNTVAKHVTSIFSKTGAANRVEAATYAQRHGLVAS